MLTATCVVPFIMQDKTVSSRFIDLEAESGYETWQNHTASEWQAYDLMFLANPKVCIHSNMLCLPTLSYS